MNENTLLRIDELNLKNYRCFSSCEVNFHPTLTVLVAENAGGKTAILDALRLALLPFVTAVGKSRSCPGFLRSDMRGYSEIGDLPSSPAPTAFLAEGKFRGETVRWRRERTERKLFGQTSRREIGEITRQARILSDLIQFEAREGDQIRNKTTLPVVAYYGTGRLYNEQRLTNAKRWLAKSSHTRMSAYLDCLSSSSSYKSFSAWFGQRWEDIGESRSRAEGFEGRPENQITAVREAVKVVLEPTGWATMDWQPAEQDDDGRTYGTGYIRLESSFGSRVPLYTQSDGIRNMVAMVGDLAHRCVRLNSHLGEGAAYETPGIVMIDEVDMHLHPRWQQLVVALLQKAFPHVQFILTTHSPHVLSTVNAECIRQIFILSGVGSTPNPKVQTRGLESAAILNDVMHVNPVPPVDEAKWLADYTALIESDSHETEEGLRLRNLLINLYGENHPIILDCNRLIRFQVFKKRKEHKGMNPNG